MALRYRVCASRIQVSEQIAVRFKDFVEKWLCQNLQPLHSLPTVREWLDHAHYTQKKKNDLLEASRSCPVPCYSEEHSFCDMFNKFENYSDFKPMRGIQARSPVVKVCMGVPCYAISEVLFRMKYFVKFLEVQKRYEHVVAQLGEVGGYLYVTDHSHFESHMSRQIMDICECALYKYMLRDFPQYAEYMCRLVTGLNKIRTPYGTSHRFAGRMSGDMCTSLGNGFTNLMAILFTVSTLGGRCDCCVEGDDGIIRSSVPITTEDFLRVGFEVKMDPVADIATSGFCGFRYGPITHTCFVEPRELLGKFSTYNDPCPGLLAAKGLSLLNENSGCPIAWALGTRALQLDHQQPWVRRTWYNHYMFGHCSDIVGDYLRLREYKRSVQRPSQIARVEFSQLYGVPVADQIEIENCILHSSRQWHCPALGRMYSGYDQYRWMSHYAVGA